MCVYGGGGHIFQAYCGGSWGWGAQNSVFTKKNVEVSGSGDGAEPLSPQSLI